MSANRPLKDYGIGPFSVSLWLNEVDAGDGTKRLMKSVSLRKGFYSRKEKKLVNQTVTMNPAEVGAVIRLLQKMQADVIERRGRQTEVKPSEDEQLQAVDVLGDDIPF